MNNAREHAAIDSRANTPERGSIGRAVFRMMPTTTLGILGILGVLGTLVFLRWRPPSDVASIYALVILPIGSVIIPILAWGAMRPGWSSIASRPPGIRPVIIIGQGDTMLLSAAVTIIVSAGLYANGLTAADAIALDATSITVAFLLMAGSWWLTILGGVNLSAGVGVIGIVLSALIGGTGMSQQFWYVAPWAWAQQYTNPSNLLIVSALSTGLGLGLTALTLSAAYRRSTHT